MQTGLLLWTTIFVLFVLASLLPYVIGVSSSLFVGIPLWVWYFIALQSVFVFTLIIYSKSHVNEDQS